jgi:hypothetical protein
VTWHEGAVITKPLLCEDGTAISAHARVDWSYDPYTHSPIVGERYQIQIEVWADDSPCGTPDVVVSFQPPPNTATAVDATAPVECYSGTEIAPGCTGLKPSENPNYRSSSSGTASTSSGRSRPGSTSGSSSPS